MRTVGFVALLAGCNSILGIQDLHDGHGTLDAPPGLDGLDGPSGSATFTGLVTHAPDGMAIAGATVALYLDTGDLVGNVVTSGTGAYSIPITKPLPIDGYFQVTATGELVTYSHVMYPAASDPHTTIAAYTRAELDTLSMASNCPMTSGGGLIVFHVFDTGRQPVQGATISTTHGAVGIGYSDSMTGVVSCNATATSADGLAYIFSTTPGTFEVIAKDAAATQFAQTTFELLADTVVVSPLKP